MFRCKVQSAGCRVGRRQRWLLEKPARTCGPNVADRARPRRGALAIVHGGVSESRNRRLSAGSPHPARRTLHQNPGPCNPPGPKGRAFGDPAVRAAGSSGQSPSRPHPPVAMRPRDTASFLLRWGPARSPSRSRAGSTTVGSAVARSSSSRSLISASAFTHSARRVETAPALRAKQVVPAVSTQGSQTTPPRPGEKP